MPRMPSAPANTGSDRIGARTSRNTMSPALRVSSATAGMSAVPVTPWTPIESASVGSSPSAATTRDETAERFAPVSRMNRNGAWPLISIGASTRPIRSLRVGVANSVSSGGNSAACAGGDSIGAGTEPAAGATLAPQASPSTANAAANAAGRRPHARTGSSALLRTVRSAKLDCTRATPGSRVRCWLCRRSKSAGSVTTTRNR